MACKKRQLPKESIADVVRILQKQGVGWINDTNLRKRVSRAYAKEIHAKANEVVLHVPPPPGTAKANTTADTIVATDENLESNPDKPPSKRQKKAGRPSKAESNTSTVASNPQKMKSQNCTMLNIRKREKRERRPS